MRSQVQRQRFGVMFRPAFQALVIFIGVLGWAPFGQSESAMAAAGLAQPNAKAPRGGALQIQLQQEPASLNPILAQDYAANQIQSYVMDSLLTHDLNTYAWRPRLAEKWEIGKDKKTFTFHLRKDAVFHDGQPLTAEDVKFSFDVVFDPKYKSSVLRPYFENIDKVEVLNSNTVKFTAKDTYFMNFNIIASMYILPKHLYSDAEKVRKQPRQLIGSGPYQLDKFDKGQSLVLKRFDKWYGFSGTEWQGYFNFDQLIFRFVKDDGAALELLKKGELDFMEINSPDTYMQKMDGAEWGKSVFKNQIENALPKPYFFVGFNFRRDFFKDKNVRLALAHLMNREEMNRRFRYNMSDLATGPQYVQSDEADSKIKAIPYDPAKATALLLKAGWKDVGNKGILSKKINGKNVEFRFTLIHAARDRAKYWEMYRDDLKKVGIEMQVQLLDWNSFLKLADSGDFDAMAMGWSGTVEWEPKAIWHSSSIGGGGSNFIAYKNKQVDRLIDKARAELDRTKRVQILHKIYEQIAEDVPYVFMFNDRYYLYANSNKVNKPSNAPAMKYDLGLDLWWH